MTAIANLPDIRPSLLLDFANSGRVDPRIQCTRASSATCFGSDGKLRTVAANVPRIDHDPATGKCLGLLVEEARTNACTYSSDLSKPTWTKTRSSVSPSANVLAPDGSSAFKLVEDTSETNSHLLSTVQSVDAGTTYTLSVYLKAAERSWVLVVFPAAQFGGNISAYFDLSTGSIGAVSPAATATITPAGGGWYRCTVTTTAAVSGSSTITAVRLAAANNSASYTGDGASGVYVWGIQLEVGAFPTSHIPTEASAVTRAAGASLVHSSLLTAFGTLLVKYGKAGWRHTNTPPAGALNLLNRIDNGTQVNDVIERVALYPRQLTAVQIARLEAA